MKFNIGSVINRILVLQNNYTKNIDMYKEKTMFNIKQLNNYLKEKDYKHYDRIYDDLGIAYIAYSD